MAPSRLGLYIEGLAPENLTSALLLVHDKSQVNSRFLNPEQIWKA